MRVYGGQWADRYNGQRTVYTVPSTWTVYSVQLTVKAEQWNAGYLTVDTGHGRLDTLDSGTGHWPAGWASGPAADAHCSLDCVAGDRTITCNQSIN